MTIGILATGGIAYTFSRDLLINPETRKVSDVKHEIRAVASSSSKQKAEAFIKKLRAIKEDGLTDTSDIPAYGSYEELANDPNMDIIYVSTPHSHHYENVKLCLNNGKNVLCEKPLTVNAAQAKVLYDLAKSKGLFLMEGMIYLLIQRYGLDFFQRFNICKSWYTKIR